MIKDTINGGNTYLGIELGSTRIKACLIDENAKVLAQGVYEWENRLENGYWTYSLTDIHTGIRACFQSLAKAVARDYGVTLTKVGAIGVSAMMHGYLAFDKNGGLLVPFRTWRNLTTERAAKELTELFSFNIPQRWSIAHLYQAVLNNEPHVSEIARVTTLAGYVHYLLTGRHEVGIGDASGIFPVKNGKYDEQMVEKFRATVSEKGFAWNIEKILPAVKRSGEKGAYLTPQGAKFLDESGRFEAGIPICPPEGDAGTGMVATNAVLPATGNVSVGTSAFAMLVLNEPLKAFYPEVDIVTTPDGLPVVMLHCNNGCSELDAWVKLFDEFARLVGVFVDKSVLYETLYKHALTGKTDCDGVVAINYLSGEHITRIKCGVPLFFRTPKSGMNLADFMRAQMYAVFATLKKGMDGLMKKEDLHPKRLQAHGGIFKVEGVASQILADALSVPVVVMKGSGEGGAWGIALLASYMQNANGKSLGEWLSNEVFAKTETVTCIPDPTGRDGFLAFMANYEAGLQAEKTLEDTLCWKN